MLFPALLFEKLFSDRHIIFQNQPVTFHDGKTMVNKQVLIFTIKFLIRQDTKSFFWNRGKI